VEVERASHDFLLICVCMVVKGLAVTVSNTNLQTIFRMHLATSRHSIVAQQGHFVYLIAAQFTFSV